MKDSLGGRGEVPGVIVGVIAQVDAGVFAEVGVMVEASDGGIAVAVSDGNMIVKVGDG